MIEAIVLGWLVGMFAVPVVVAAIINFDRLLDKWGSNDSDN